MRARTRILDAAMVVFRRHGFRRSSIEQAAEAAGLTRQALYHHFESREALFRAVIDELFSEHLVQARDLYQKHAGLYGEQLVATIERVCRKQRLGLAENMTARGLARCIEMAISGTKSVHPEMQPADAFLKDLEIMLRTLVAGAAGLSPKPHPAKPATATKSRLTKPGDRK